MACKYILDGREYTEQEFKTHVQSQFMNRPKTRRILEVQSDLFQKGRDKENLASPFDKPTKYNHETGDVSFERDGFTYIRNKDGLFKGTKNAPYKYELSQTEFEKVMLEQGLKDETKDNQFLQLLNKDGNWIPFFIKSIVQDSAKKGYEKVLFPTGDTASKVEGHETLEGFKQQKESRIRELEKRQDATIVKESDKGGIFYRRYMKDGTPLNGTFLTEKDAKEELDRWSESNTNELNQLQEELKRVETEGFAALKPIYNFYENRVKNTLDKIYGKDNVKRIKDEYGNEWYEISLEDKSIVKPFVTGTSPSTGLTTAKFEGLSQPSFGLTPTPINRFEGTSETTVRKEEVPKNTLESVSKLEADQKFIQLDDTINPETQQRRHKYYIIDDKGNRLYDIDKSVTEDLHKKVKARPGEENLGLILAEKGTKNHRTIENIIKSYLNFDGTIRGPQDISPTEDDNPAVFGKLYSYVDQLMSYYRGRGVKIIPECKVVDGKSLAGTIDLLVIYPDGSYDKYDWKFIKNLSEERGLDKDRKEVFKKQSDKLAEILAKTYNLKDRRKDFMIPIKLRGKEIEENDKIIDFEVEDISIAPFDAAELSEKEMYLQPFVVHYKESDNDELQHSLETLHNLYKHSIRNYESMDKAEKVSTDIRIDKLQKAAFGITFRKDLSELSRYVLAELSYVPQAIEKRRQGDKSINLDRILERLTAIEDFNKHGLKNQLTTARKNSEMSADELQILDHRNKEFFKIIGKLAEYKELVKKAAIEYSQEEADIIDLGDVKTPEQELEFSQRWITSSSQIQMKNMQLATQKLFQAREDALRNGSERGAVFTKLSEDMKKASQSPTGLYKKYLLEKGHLGEYKIVHKYKAEFYKERKNIIQSEDLEELKAWFVKNTVFDRARYEQDLENYTKDLESATKTYNINGKETAQLISFDDVRTQIKEFQEKYDPGEAFTNTRALKTGDFANKYLIPTDKWYSDSYKEIENNPTLLELYNNIISINKELASYGQIEEHEIYTKFPNVGTSILEGKKQGQDLDVFGRMWEGISISRGEAEHKSELNPLTSQEWKEIRMPFMGTGDSRQSIDIPKVYKQVVEALEGYKSLRNVENDLNTLLIAERNKPVKALSKGKVTDAAIQSETNSNLLRDIIDIQLYGKTKDREATIELANTFVGKIFKLDSDRVFSQKKFLHWAIAYNSLLGLAIRPRSILANIYGGQGNINFQGKAGVFFNSNQINKAHLMWMRRDPKLMAALKYFNFRMQKSPDTLSFTDIALTGQRMGDHIVEDHIGAAMLQMYKLNSDGKIVNIRTEVLRSGKEYSPKELQKEIDKQSKENSLLSTMKIGDDKKPYWEIDGKKIDLDAIPTKDGKPTDHMSPMTKLKNTVLQVAYKTIGNMNPEDRSGMHIFDAASAFTQYRNWIPGQVEARFGKWKYESVTEQYSVGRWREFFTNFLSKDGVGGFMKHQMALHSFFGGDLANPSLREASNRRYEKVKGDMAKRGIDFKMSQEEFFHQQVGIAKSLARETLFTVGTLALFTMVMSMAKDETDPDTKARLAFTSKLLDKFYNEFSFYFNPHEFEQLFKNSLPLISLFSNFKNLLWQPMRETFGWVTQDEDLQEKAKPIKATLQLIPGATVVAEMISLFDDDIRKYMGYNKLETGAR